jgi:hypothetical protein
MAWKDIDLSEKMPDTKSPSSIKQSKGDIMVEKMSKVDKEIEARGNLWENIKKDFQKEGVLGKIKGGLGIVSSPFTSLEAGIANPALALQRNPFENAQSTNTLGVLGEGASNLAKEAFLGFLGQKQGQYGDVYRSSGNPFLETVSAPAGLTLAVSPVKVVKTINKTFGNITRMSDKGIMKAGKSLISAGDDAVEFIGSKLNKAYETVNNIKVNPEEFVSEMSKLPKAVLSKVEDTLGGVEELSQNLTISTLRKIKQIIGKYSPSSFGKDTRGVTEKIIDDEINAVYKGVKTLISKTIAKNTSDDIAESILNLDDAFREVKNSADYIKKTIVDSTLKKPTKGGAMAKKLIAEGDVTGRTALNTIKSAGSKARDNINKAVSALESFNKWQGISENIRKAINAGIYGGVAGSLGGLALGKAVNKKID